MATSKSAKTVHGLWSSPWMFVLAGSGFVIGLRSFWQFPNHLALYGGSAFLLFYLLFVLILGVPLLMTHLMLGRMGRASPTRTISSLARRVHAPGPWRRLGSAAALGGFLVWVYYNVAAGWLLAYVVRGVSGTLDGLTEDGAASIFTALVRDPEKQLFWHGLFVVLSLVPLAYGLRAGLERVVRIVVPVIAFLLVLLVGYAASGGAFRVALGYFLRFDFAQLGVDGVLVALGDAFFGLGLGVGTFMMYGALLPTQVSVLRMSLYVVSANVAAGVLASLAIFPVLFASGGLSTQGPGLVFQSLTVAFDALPMGWLMRVLLFVVLVLVAWMSTIALAEPVVARLVEQRGMTRMRAVFLTGAASWAVGALAMVSLHPWAFSFSVFGISRTLGFFDVLVMFTSLLLLPVVGLLCALFAGWILPPETTRTALAIRPAGLHDVWLWLNRLVVPALVIALYFGIRLFL